MFRVFPVLLIVVVIYNLVAVAHGLAGNDAMQTFLSREHQTFHMFRGIRGISASAISCLRLASSACSSKS